jgi:DNA-binding IclR family transcriptional regulator
MRKRKVSPAAAGEAPAEASAETAVDSLERGLELLRLFQDPAGTALTIAQMATRMNLSKATVQRLAGTLVARGFLTDTGHGTHFAPDVGVLVVGHAYLASQDKIKAARPTMQKLAEAERAQVLLGTREREGILCLAHSSDDQEHDAVLGAGTLMPMATTALGRAWLWAQPSAVQSEWLARIRANAGGDSARVMAGIYRAFQGMESDGYCVAVGEWAADISGIATAIQLPNETLVLGCKTRGKGPTAQRIASLGAPLVEAASAIRLALSRGTARH